MSRINVAKGRNDKGGKTANAPTPHQAVEIIPGKFTDQDWFSLLDHDDSDEFVFDIVQSLFDGVLAICYNRYIQKQIIPYNIMKAKCEILELIKWQFLVKDFGEGSVNEDTGWLEEQEPEAIQTDCWAQGAVPRVAFTTRPLSAQPRTMIIDEPIIEITEPDTPQSQPATGFESVRDEAPFGGIDHEETIDIVDEGLVIEGQSMVILPSPPQESPKDTPREVAKPKRGYKPHYGKLLSAKVSGMTESLREAEMKAALELRGTDIGLATSPDREELLMPLSMQSVIKLQAGRPPGNRDVVFDVYGQVVCVAKIDPTKMPNHRVRTRYNIIDPQVEAAKNRLEAMRTGKYVHTSNQLVKPIRIIPNKTELAPLKLTKSPLPPAMIETMEVSPGVTVQEYDRVKKGPRPRLKDLDIIEAALKKGLKPVPYYRDPTIPVSHVVTTNVPVIRSIVPSNPVPPINGRSH